MKAFNSLFVLVVISVSLISCEKKYTCHCDYKTNGSLTAFQDFSIDGKKDYAVEKCDERDTDQNIVQDSTTYNYKAECELKNK